MKPYHISGVSRTPDQSVEVTIQGPGLESEGVPYFFDSEAEASTFVRGLNAAHARYHYNQIRGALPFHSGRSWLRWPRAANLLLIVLLLPLHTLPDATGPRRTPLPAIATEAPPNVWLVEHSGDEEVYSNGLRIEDQYTVSNRPRLYAVFNPYRFDPTPEEFRTEPAGIVFHTTESFQAPFEADENGVLQKVSERLLKFIQRNHAYHFVIDRFGRVFRVVAEQDAANHAGYSVWVDSKWMYLNLNSSFLGVSFEAQTQDGSAPPINAAQIHAAKVLVEMLRSKYHIPAWNCVTHAQVSVNPSNMQVGYHTDWAAHFPFAAIGLPDNYPQPLPGLFALGCGYDSLFENTVGADLKKGVTSAESMLREESLLQGVPVDDYTQALRKSYRERLAILTRVGIIEKTGNSGS